MLLNPVGGCTDLEAEPRKRPQNLHLHYKSLFHEPGCMTVPLEGQGGITWSATVLGYWRNGSCLFPCCCLADYHHGRPKYWDKGQASITKNWPSPCVATRPSANGADGLSPAHRGQGSVHGAHGLCLASICTCFDTNTARRVGNARKIGRGKWIRGFGVATPYTHGVGDSKNCSKTHACTRNSQLN